MLKCSKVSLGHTGFYKQADSISRFRTQATNTSTVANYANGAYDLLPSNMASETLTAESMIIANDVIMTICITIKINFALFTYVV